MVLPSLMAGASVVCTPRFTAPEFFAWMAEFHPTWYSAVPTIHQAILDSAAGYRDNIARGPLRFIRSTSAPLPRQVLEALEGVFNVPVIESYGTTEVSMVTCNPLPPRPRKAGSVGVAVGAEVAILDEVGKAAGGCHRGGRGTWDKHDAGLRQRCRGQSERLHGWLVQDGRPGVYGC